MRHLHAFSMVLIGCATGVLACAGASRSPEVGTSRRTLLGDEIRAAAGLSTAYEAVSRLRPEWLRRHGQVSIRNSDAGAVIVYLDGVRYGELQTLQSIRASSVLQMRFLSGPEATTRYGTGHVGGAILIETQ